MMITRIYGVLLGYCLLVLLPATAQVNQSIVISGKVAFQNPEMFKKYNMVWLYKGMAKDKVAIDSVKVNADGTFRLKPKVTAPGLFTLDILKWQTTSFWSDQDVTIQARGYDTGRHKAKNSGFVEVESKSTSTRLINMALYNQFLASEEMSLLEEESVAARQNAQQDLSWLNFLKEVSPGKRKQETEALRLKQLIGKNQDNPAVIFLLKMVPASDEKYFTEQLDRLMARFPQLNEAKQLKADYLAQAAIKNAIKKGSKIPRIAYNDPEGNPLDIGSFKGKYVLVDFWASWCGPCRKAIPEIKELYAQFKPKGFEVLSVSVDTDQAAWRKAMAEENMPWSQVLSPDKTKTLSEFMIVGIPTIYLIDREGRIIEKYTGFSAKLKTQLESLLN